VAIDWSQGYPRVIKDGLTQRDGSWFTAPDADNLYGNQVDDPYRQANFRDFQGAGLWSNLGDLNSPFWNQYFGSGPGEGARSLLQSDPNKFAKTFFSLSGINPLTAGADELNAIRSAGLTPTQLGELQGTAVATQQSAMDKDWDDYAHQGMEMGLNLTAGAIMGGGFSALGGELFAGGGSASGGGTSGTAATSAGTGAGDAQMWDWLDQFSGVPDDIGFDFMPGESLTTTYDPTGLGAGDFTSPFANVPNDLGYDYLPGGVGYGEGNTNLVGIADDVGGSDFIPGAPLKPTSNPLEWMKYPANTPATYLKWLTGAGGLPNIKSLFGGDNASGGSTGRSVGGGILDLLRNDPLQAAFNATPFLLALTEANRQSDDLNGVIGKINGDAYARSILNPYDMDTALGRTNMMQDQQLRGVRGSSFGNNDITNYDYMRSLGRGDLFNRANVATAGLEGNLINQRNTNRNLLLGAGLNASGRMFQPQSDPFGLENIRRALGGGF
jgi:hypothetical protein